MKRILVLFSCVILFSAISAAQTYNQADPAQATGLRPLSGQSGSDIDSIDVFGGDLHVEIPLVTLAGRGRDSRLRLIYNSIIYKTVTDAFDSDIIKCRPAGEIYRNPSAGWNLTAAEEAHMIGPVQRESTSLNHVVETLNVVDVDGTTHTLTGEQGEISSLINNTVFRSSDSTYMVYYKDGARLYRKDGRRDFHDTNGNDLYGDSLGRTFTTTTRDSFNQSTVTYTASDGTLATIYLGYAEYPMNCGGYSISQPQTQILLTSVTLPNGQVYRFDYDNNGELSKIILPSGGYLRYGYSGSNYSGDLGAGRGSVGTRVVSYDGINESTWIYSRTTDPGIGAVVTITDPLGNQEVHQYSSGFPNGHGNLETKILKKTVLVMLCMKRAKHGHTIPCSTGSATSMVIPVSYLILKSWIAGCNRRLPLHMIATGM